MLDRASSAQSNDCIARARALAPLIATYAAHTEQAREIAPEVLSALHDARLFRLLLPRSCGGLGGRSRDLPAGGRGNRQGGRAARPGASSRRRGCSMTAAYVEPEVAREIFGGPRGAGLGAGGPESEGRSRSRVATRVAVPGALRAASNVSWLGCHFPIEKADGTQRLDPDGDPAIRTLIIPKASAGITDIWHVVGLHGTGSDKYSVTDLFVPRCLSREPRRRPPRDRPALSLDDLAALRPRLRRRRDRYRPRTLDAFIALAAHKAPS